MGRLLLVLLLVKKKDEDEDEDLPWFALRTVALPAVLFLALEEETAAAVLAAAEKDATVPKCVSAHVRREHLGENAAAAAATCAAVPSAASAASLGSSSASMAISSGTVPSSSIDRAARTAPTIAAA